MSDEEATLQVQASEGGDGEFLRTGFDLVVIDPEGRERTVPVCRATTSIGAPGPKSNDIDLEDPGLANRQALLHYRQGRLYFTNAAPAVPVLLNGEPVSFRELSDQDVLHLGHHRIRVVGLLDTLATLEGYTEPYRARKWAIGSDPVPIGRPGKRENRVELKDPTVSRGHATIRLVDGAFFLEPETDVSPTLVNGEQVHDSRVLADGDLVHFGQQMLRFRTARGSARPRTLMPQDATILFSDIWNYSSLSESRPLEETIGQMNEFYRAMGKVIEAHQGLLMTFLGDAMMAVFGADRSDPEDPVLAVTAALRMQERLVDLNDEWRARGMPTMRIGVGINTGEVMMGDVGFTGRFEFAAMGDNTNLAARLEKLTREYDAGVLISGSTEARVRGRFAMRGLGSTRVKGRETPVELFEVLGGLE